MIVSDQHTLSGKPRLSGTRLAVCHVLRALMDAGSFEGVRVHYPEVSDDEIRECLRYAADKMEKRRKL